MLSVSSRQQQWLYNHRRDDARGKGFRQRSTERDRSQQSRTVCWKEEYLMQHQNVIQVLNDPLAQELLHSPIFATMGPRSDRTPRR